MPSQKLLFQKNQTSQQQIEQDKGFKFITEVFWDKPFLISSLDLWEL